jgi:alanyl-tRNA synthetase
MKADTLRKEFINFFLSKNHKQIPSASLIPEDDPTILFTPAGMSPLVRYLMGEKHPLGKRLCSIQKCVRTDDIEEVGDLTHFTFFEMLGNWSLGDYFKREAIKWSFEFIIQKKWLNLNPNNIYISVFAGDKDAPKDVESILVWKQVFSEVGIKARQGDVSSPNLQNGDRIFAYSKKENWWGPAGKTGPCGPCTEMFYDTGKTHDKRFGKNCHPNCKCGRFFEFWNDVFMEYYKNEKGKFKPLLQKNVDTGMGLERVVALTEYLDGKIAKPDPYLSHLFYRLIIDLEDASSKKYNQNAKTFRTIADHLRASVFIIADGVLPSNKDRGYILRRLIRRLYDYLTRVEIKKISYLDRLIDIIIDIYKKEYPNLGDNKKIKTIINEEVKKYSKLILNIEKKIKNKQISANKAFTLFTTFGLSPEQLIDRGYKFNRENFNKKMQKHREISRKGMDHKFSGGMQSKSSKVIKLHTATHLLHESLRRVLGNHVRQIGSNITEERLRFDFTHPKNLTKEQIKRTENIVNEQIKKNLTISFQIMNLKQAKTKGALAFFSQKYPEKVKVYSVGRFSKEVCGGPHVDFTGKLGKFMIGKEESIGAGKRRIYATLINKK